MSPQAIFFRLLADGITLKLSAEGRGLVVPAGKLSAEQRALVMGHKIQLIAFLADTRETTARLIAAAMKACDHHQDSDAAREQMRLDCLNTPQHLRADLLDHFTQIYETPLPVGPLVTIERK